MPISPLGQTAVVHWLTLSPHRLTAECYTFLDTLFDRVSNQIGWIDSKS